jgi:two-component system response regulator FixJ
MRGMRLWSHRTNAVPGSIVIGRSGHRAHRETLLASSAKTTVIVIDDDPSICRALKTLLRILGFEVVLFRTAEEMLAGTVPVEGACLLSDVYLPGMNGIELCQLLSERGPHLPIILMTGRDDEHTKRLMRAAKPIASLFKPFDEADLLRAIRKAGCPI